MINQPRRTVRMKKKPIDFIISKADKSQGEQCA